MRENAKQFLQGYIISFTFSLGLNLEPHARKSCVCGASELARVAPHECVDVGRTCFNQPTKKKQLTVCFCMSNPEFMSKGGESTMKMKAVPAVQWERTTCCGSAPALP